MDNIQVVKSYFTALESNDLEQVDRCLAEDYRLVDFFTQPLNQEDMLAFFNQFKAAFPDLRHSLSNIRSEANLVKLTVQLSGTNSGHLDLLKMGVGVIPRTNRFIIFPSADYEFTMKNGKISQERDVSPVSPSRRMLGRLRAMGLNVGAKNPASARG